MHRSIGLLLMYIHKHKPSHMYANSNPLQQQIQNIRQIFPNIREVQPNAIYDVSFYFPDCTPAAYRLFFPSQFPNYPPKIQVLPSVIHPILGPDGTVLPSAHSSITQWTPRVNLGLLLFEISQEFLRVSPKTAVFVQTAPQKDYPPSSYSPYSSNNSTGNQYNSSVAPNPPIPSATDSFTNRQQAPAPPPSYNFNPNPAPPPYGQKLAATPTLSSSSQNGHSSSSSISRLSYDDYKYNSSNNIHPASTQNVPTFTPTKSGPSSTFDVGALSDALPDLDLPKLPAAIPQLEKKTESELQEILTNEDEFLSLFATLPQVEEINKRRAKLIQRNEEQAFRNQQLAQEMGNKRGLVEARRNLKNERMSELRALNDRCMNIQQRYASHSLAKILAQAADESERESEYIVEAFNDGKIDLKEFLQKYTDKRKQHHLRCAKKECLSNGMSCIGQANSSSSSSSSSFPSSSSSSSSFPSSSSSLSSFPSMSSASFPSSSSSSFSSGGSNSKEAFQSYPLLR
eukprot:TRINITY_DN108_c0_g1_i1.p1 TRINITY_DN108_c0_g1~~TRINITY_DN108_c0_g1_i1.p1  ORF type:complete len:513 (+),score=126.94 TRINITY_DN108_c0_g1_i1:76-1614(+)